MGEPGVANPSFFVATSKPKSMDSDDIATQPDAISRMFARRTEAMKNRGTAPPPSPEKPEVVEDEGTVPPPSPEKRETIKNSYQTPERQKRRRVESPDYYSPLFGYEKLGSAEKNRETRPRSLGVLATCVPDTTNPTGNKRASAVPTIRKKNGS